MESARGAVLGPIIPAIRKVAELLPDSVELLSDSFKEDVRGRLQPITIKQLLMRLAQSVFPEISKSVSCELRIAYRMRDVLVPEVLLDRSSVMTIVSKLVAAGMAQHMGVYGKRKRRIAPCPANHFPHS